MILKYLRRQLFLVIIMIINSLHVRYFQTHGGSYEPAESGYPVPELYEIFVAIHRTIDEERYICHITLN